MAEITTRGANAYLSYSGAGFTFWLTEYSQSHEMGGSRRFAKMYGHWYSKNYSPGLLRVSGRVRSQKKYEQLAEFVRKHQILIAKSSGKSNIQGGGIPLMNLGVVRGGSDWNENFRVWGWIESFSAGANKDNVKAPKFTFEFYTVRDAHSLNHQIRPSYAIKKWWTGAEVTGRPNIIEEGPESNTGVAKGGDPNRGPGDDRPG